ncbi:MAG TPA: hypothetical protein ENJ82_03900 [Bacteroidetes bacterium]|nr:hypothetical protein [Bacteroidota bacterium]
MSLQEKIKNLSVPGVGRHLLTLYQNEHGITNELIEAWIDFSGKSENQLALGEDLMWDVIALSDKVSHPAYLLELCLIEAHLKLMHEDTQETWETLERALYLKPEEERIHTFLAELNAEPEESPSFQAGMERIAERVAAGKFPGQIFKKLLRILADPANPNKYKLAIYRTAIRPAKV